MSSIFMDSMTGNYRKLGGFPSGIVLLLHQTGRSGIKVGLVRKRRLNTMAKPIYAGSYQNRGRNRGKVVFIVVIVVQLIAVGAYLYLKKDKEPGVGEAEVPASLAPTPAAPVAGTPVAPPISTFSPETSAIVSDARAAIAAGQLVNAQSVLDKLVEATPDPDAIKLLGEINMQLLKPSLMMPGKEYYAIQSGDYLQKIANKYNTTVELIKEMNGFQTEIWTFDSVSQGSSRILVGEGSNYWWRAKPAQDEFYDVAHTERHGKRANYLFVDLHLESLKPSAAWDACINPGNSR